MPFAITSTLAQEHDRIRRQAASLPDRRRSALVRIGFYLVTQQKRHFRQLVETGSANGTTWPRPAPSTIRRRQALARRGLLANADPQHIGQQSGRLANSFRFVTHDRTVAVYNAAPYANAFNARRPLFPLPAAWKAGCERIAQTLIPKESTQ